MAELYKENFTRWIKFISIIEDSLTSKECDRENKPQINNSSTNTNYSNKKARRKSKEEEERIICKDIISMDMNSVYNQTNSNSFFIVIPLNVLNVTSLSILFVLIIFGSYYVWKIFTRKKCLCKICKNEYIIEEKLGEGGFGEKKDQNLILKRCRTENITEADDILIEAKYLRNLEHKNIVKYIDDFIHIEMNKGKLEPTYYVIIIMELCEGGDLKNQIDTMFYNHKQFTKYEMLDLVIQICEALNYMHNINIIHRDIKSQNIFMTKNNIVRIGDFGLAKKLKKNNRNSYMTKVGTDCYMAPEIMQGELYGKPADVWSLGCVIYEMCTLNFMWMNDVAIGLSSITKKDFIDSFLGEIEDSEHQFFKDILKHIFVTNPGQRIKVHTLLKKLKKEKSIINNKKHQIK